MHRNIVIGFDGTDQSCDAVRLAGWLARAAGDADVTVVTVYAYDELRGRLANTVAFETEPSRDAQRDADRACEMLGDLPSVCCRTIASHSPARVLHEVALERGADLIVVGSAGNGPAGRITPGSVGSQVLHGSPCAVAIAPRACALGRRGAIGAAFDGSAASREALRAAVSLASALGEKPTVISVVQPPANPDVIAFGSDYAESLRGDAHERIDEVLAAIDPTAAVAHRVMLGSPTANLLEQSGGLDLLVMGARGYGRLGGILLGSTSTVIAREAHCPVLMLPRAASRERGGFAQALAVAAQR